MREIKKMNKWIKKVLIGSIFIIIIIPVIGYLCYSSERSNAKEELQEVIDNKYLEGKDEIGAYFFDIEFVRLDKVADFDASDELCWMSINKTGMWNSLVFSNVEQITKVMNSGEYQWYNFNMDSLSPFMIVVKKTDRGYDIIGEYIVGMGLKNNYPQHLIHQTSSKFNWGKKMGGEQIHYSYSITPDLVYDYINYLDSDKYEEYLIRSETSHNKYSHKHNEKLELLGELVKKFVCPADESLYFRTNKYFELKYDDYYTYIGTSPIQFNTGSYGNNMQQLFTQTVTLHYSIQENEGVLKNEYIERFSYILLGLLSLYLLILFCLYKIAKRR